VSYHQNQGTCCEVFHWSPACDEHGGWEKSANGSCHECAMLSGWYWWACFPGCLPDGDPVGPFGTEQEAIDDIRQSC
jgi:hypothetical protein